MRRSTTLILSLICILLPLTVASGSDEVDLGTGSTGEKRFDWVDLTLDGVELTLTTPFLPNQNIILPEPGDSVQVANIVQREPLYNSLTITAIPYGSNRSVEIFPPIEPNKTEYYRNLIFSYRQGQGAVVQSGPTATLFGEDVTGIMSTGDIYIDVHEAKPVRIVEWVFEGGNRLWVLRISQEVPLIGHLSNATSDQRAMEELTGIKLNGANLDSVSTSALDLDGPTERPIYSFETTDSDLPFPSWWDGDCDTNTYHAQTGIWAYPLGGSYRGMKACGPRPWADGAPNAIVQFFPGAWGVLEWECVELSMRFLYLAYGIPPYQANGNQVVPNYSGDQLIKINNGTPGIAPQPNDVMSSGPETPVGHTSIVMESNVDLSGNGTVTILEQNSSTSGIRTRDVVNWEVLSTYTVIGWLHDPENSDMTSPIGDILSPIGQQTYETSLVNLEGWATDEESGLGSAQFIANYDSVWQDIGPSFSEIHFSYGWDWCAEDVPDGPLSLALLLSDQQGNQNNEFPGLRHIIKHYACPATPVCVPNPDQIAIFSDLNYRGDCQTFGIGIQNNSSFSIVGDNNVESLILGGNVEATLFTVTEQQGRRETISVNDPNLFGNLIGANSLSSLKVSNRNELPSIPIHEYPTNMTVYTNLQSIFLHWKDSGGGDEMRATIDGPSISETTPWGKSSSWSLGSLSPGIYSWRIQARNEAGQSDWSLWQFITINDDPASSIPSITAPFTDTLEGDTSNWRQSGLWHKTDDDSHSSNHSWWYGESGSNTYDEGEIAHGSLTTPPIEIPATSKSYLLTFWSKYETESSNTFWDQRWIQLSVDGGDFKNIYQLEADPYNVWVKHLLDLSPYYLSGSIHNIQVRFYFTSIDPINNNYRGWLVDDIQIQASISPTCADLFEDNNTPGQATNIAYNNTINAEICPGGDFDYYRFSGSPGDMIVVDIDAKTSGSTLDAIVSLLDGDGESILATHDDEVAEISLDPHLGYRIPRDGIYYLKVQAWDHPMGKGQYSLHLFTDNVRPTSQSSLPPDGGFLPSTTYQFETFANDNLSGISHVQFMGYAGGWSEISSDWDGTDGWTSTFETSELEEGQVLNFYIRVFDWAGNWAGEGAWDISLDFTHPDTTSAPLPSPNDTTAIHLEWTSTDNLAGILSYHIRNSENGGDWITEELDNASPEYWFIGNAGSNYTFRIRATDNAGNIEPYLDGAEVSTSIPSISSLCSSPDSWDQTAWVNDNNYESSTLLNRDWQTHNFCNPTTVDRLGDEDWFNFLAEKDQRYIISVQPLHNSAMVSANLYASDGSTLLAEAVPVAFGQATTLEWKALQDGIVYIKLHHPDRRVAGSTVAYKVMVSKPITYFPLIVK